MARKKSNSQTNGPTAKAYRHTEAESPLRPEIGTQAQFKKKKPPVTYRYDSSLSPAMDWDGQNPAREVGEEHLSVVSSQLSELREKLANGAKPGEIEPHLARAQEAVEQLKAISRPFLNRAGKAERLSFDVPTLPLFIHERPSTKGIIETLKGHKQSKAEQLGFEAAREVHAKSYCHLYVIGVAIQPNARKLVEDSEAAK